MFPPETPFAAKPAPNGVASEHEDDEVLLLDLDSIPPISLEDIPGEDLLMP